MEAVGLRWAKRREEGEAAHLGRVGQANLLLFSETRKVGKIGKFGRAKEK